MTTMETPLRLQIRIEMDRAAAAGDWERHAQLEQQWMDVLLGRQTLDSLEARLERLDARRKQAPGQLGLDLGGGGPGTGKPCGESHIEASKTCHKGGAAPAAVLDTSKPFSDEELKAIGDGMRQRFLTMSMSRQTADDVIGAMTRMAQGHGIIGENARKALAFIHEEQPLIHAVPNVGDYESEGEPNGLRELRKGKRAGLFTEERLKLLEQDQSPRGRRMAERLRSVLALKDEDFETDQARVAELQKAVDDLDGRLQRGEISPNDHYVAHKPAWAALQQAKFGASEASWNVYQACREALVSRGSGGVFKVGSSQYWVRSTPAVPGSALDPSRIDPGAISSEIGATLDSLQSAEEFRAMRSSGGYTPPVPRPHTVASLGNLHLSAIALSTHYHELGHLIHSTASQYADERPVADQPIVDMHRVYPTNTDRAKPPAAVADQIRQRRGPTAYSNTNREEMFAEGFALYVMAPVSLKEHYPDLYQWVDATVAKARDNARSLKALPPSDR